MVLSQSSGLRIAASVFATIAIGFGINAAINPASALSAFEFEYPVLPAQKTLVDNLLLIYGVRDIFMGLAMYATVYTKDSKALGWIVVAASAVAFADGLICFQQGKGQWNHWGYAPVLTAVGVCLLGAFDGTPK